MCHEATNQMNELLEGVKPSLMTKGLKLLAMTQDKNFQSVDERFDDMREYMDEKFNLIIKIISENKIDTDNKIEDINTKHEADKKADKEKCIEHKKELSAKFKEIDDKTEDVAYFKRHPKLLLVIIFGIVFILGIAFGGSHVLELFKVIK